MASSYRHCKKIEIGNRVAQLLAHHDIIPLLSWGTCISTCLSDCTGCCALSVYLPLFVSPSNFRCTLATVGNIDKLLNEIPVLPDNLRARILQLMSKRNNLLTDQSLSQVGSYAN